MVSPHTVPIKKQETYKSLSTRINLTKAFDRLFAMWHEENASSVSECGSAHGEVATSEVSLIAPGTRYRNRYRIVWYRFWYWSRNHAFPNHMSKYHWEMRWHSWNRYRFSGFPIATHSVYRVLQSINGGSPRNSSYNVLALAHVSPSMLCSHLADRGVQRHALMNLPILQHGEQSFGHSSPGMWHELDISVGLGGQGRRLASVETRCIRRPTRPCIRRCVHPLPEATPSGLSLCCLAKVLKRLHPTQSC